jgi:hypothetical protein
MRDNDLTGKRVKFISSSDPYTRINYGTLGTVRFVDDAGTVHVKWDDGSSLGMIYGEDRFVVIEN